MSLAEITAALWRRRLLFAVTLLACFAVVALITAAVPRIYRATATVYVGTDTPNLGTDQGEQLARTYTTIAGNPNIAQAALAALHLGLTRQQLLDKMSFTPVERTQLLEISAEDQSATKAQSIANTYATVFSNSVNAQVQSGDAPASVAVNQPAVAPADPVRPNPPVYLAFGALLSLLIAVAVVVVRDRLDRRIRVSPQDDEIQGQTILARIPTLLDAGPTGTDGRSARFANAARILRSDAFRVLRTNLDLAGGSPARTIMVTSPGQGEGKTTVAAQLALTIATDRESVAIVECDLRRSALGRTGFGQDWKRPSKGLAEFLNGDATAKQVITEAPSIPELTIVWGGKAMIEPGPLLRSDRLPTLIQHLSREHKWVILDTPPIAVGDDSLVVSSVSDGAVVVVDAEETTASALDAGLKQLRRVRAPVLGVVLNHAPPAELDAYRYLTEEPGQGMRQARQRPVRQTQNR
jgi:succinoglycan biosynthesis transport protein ExoP